MARQRSLDLSMLHIYRRLSCLIDQWRSSEFGEQCNGPLGTTTRTIRHLFADIREEKPNISRNCDGFSACSASRKLLRDFMLQYILFLSIPSILFLNQTPSVLNS
ncbi:hypothetical protein BDZ91DRAFT_732796 [Kalaharituber pfeilii]|nr:hypothetical protein BDZ91DRAFT_732796 [Kalaharituber pfeilii]